MTWPTGNISTANVDNGLDNPALARVQIKQSIDDINAVVAEFGNVGISSAANLQVLQYSGSANQWQNGYLAVHRITEPIYDFGSASGNITVDYNNGNVQRITASGNIAFAMNNFPTSGTVTVLVQHGVTPALATWPNTVVASNNDRFLSTDSNVADIVHISTIGSTATYYVSIIKGYI